VYKIRQEVKINLQSYDYVVNNKLPIPNFDGFFEPFKINYGVVFNALDNMPFFMIKVTNGTCDMSLLLDERLKLMKGRRLESKRTRYQLLTCWS